MTAPEPAEVHVRPARVTDVPDIAVLIQPHVQRRVLLPRTAEELRNLIRNGFVAEASDQIVGFVAVDIYSKKLAELQCLAVADGFQGQGIGQRLVQACVECTQQHEVRELMAITAAEEFFEGCGFHYTLPDQKKALFISTRPRN